MANYRCLCKVYAKLGLLDDFNQEIQLWTLVGHENPISKANCTLRRNYRRTVNAGKVPARKGRKRTFRPDRTRSSYLTREILDVALFWNADELRGREARVFDGILSGKNPHELASQEGITRNAIDRVIRRIMVKVADSTLREDVADEFAKQEHYRRLTLAEFATGK